MTEQKPEWVGRPNDSSDLELPPATAMERGIKATRAWLEAHKITPYRFALDNGIDTGVIHRLLAGKVKRMSLDLAMRVERGTKGDVPAKTWAE